MASFTQVGTLVKKLEGVSQNDHLWIMSNSQIAIGSTPMQPEKIFDLAAEEMRALGTTQSSAPEVQPTSTQPPLKSSRYRFKIEGKTFECSSLRDLLKKGLQEIEGRHPGMLDELTKVKPRTKRIVARKKGDLFEDQALVEKYAEKLTDGWWFGTNNSTDETRQWLMRACEFTKMQFGTDFDTSI